MNEHASAVNKRVWKREIRCKLKNNSKSQWSSRLLNRAQEHSNVIGSQFHNSSISATLSPAHPLYALTCYLFSTYKMMVALWGGSGETCTHRGEYKVTHQTQRLTAHTERCSRRTALCMSEHMFMNVNSC